MVITILAMLAALGTVGIMRALDTAKQTRIKIEIDNLDTALKAYKEKYGSYPPCDLYYDGATGPRHDSCDSGPTSPGRFRATTLPIC